MLKCVNGYGGNFLQSSPRHEKNEGGSINAIANGAVKAGFLTFS